MRLKPFQFAPIFVVAAALLAAPLRADAPESAAAKISRRRWSMVAERTANAP